MSIRSGCIQSVTAAALLVFAAAAAAEGSGPDYNNRGDSAPSGAAMTADLVLARPLGFAATLLGAVVFVAGLPFELLAGNVADPARRLVADPARYTFTRPLGEDVN
ncbi:MAG: hypothetical protein NVS9B10_27330 [Nevskia sp.]